MKTGHGRPVLLSHYGRHEVHLRPRLKMCQGVVFRYPVIMRIAVEIPDELAKTLARGQDPARAVLEALGLEAYRQRRISGYQLRMLLGIPSRYEFDGFLKEHQVEQYTAEDFERDFATKRLARVRFG